MKKQICKKNSKCKQRKIKGGIWNKYEMFSIPIDPVLHSTLSPDEIDYHLKEFEDSKKEVEKELEKQKDIKQKRTVSLEKEAHENNIADRNSYSNRLESDRKQKRFVFTNIKKSITEFVVAVVKSIWAVFKALLGIIKVEPVASFIIFIIVCLFVYYIVFGRSTFSRKPGFHGVRVGLDYDNPFKFPDFNTFFWDSYGNLKDIYNRALYSLGINNTVGVYREEYKQGRGDNLMYMKLGKLIDNDIMVDGNQTISKNDNNYYSIVKPLPIEYRYTESSDLSKLPEGIKKTLTENNGLIKFIWDKAPYNDSIKYNIQCDSYNAKTGEKLNIFENGNDNNTCKYKEYDIVDYRTSKQRYINAPFLDNFIQQ